MVRLHAESEYAAICEHRRLISQSAAILSCDVADVVKMGDGLMKSVDMLRRVIGGGTVSDDEVRSLPKRYRKPFKRVKR